MLSQNLARHLAAALALFVICASTSDQGPEQTATVHLKFVNYRGEDLGTGLVTLFEDEDSQNLANKFVLNTARSIPFGVYHLRAHKQLFSFADYTVRVYQSDVWMVVQLNVSEENGPLRYQISGSVTGASGNSPLWIRAQGLYSGIIADTQAGSKSDFEIAGLPAGTYILTTRQDDRILDLRSVMVPPKGQERTSGVVVPVQIKLNP